jgi:NAD(P)-dependent dehydrogenase (short-subunit alcohol dehydrogenase family)
VRLAGKRAVVAGGGGAIGSAIARGFAREGASVVILDLRAMDAEKTAASIVASGGQACGWRCDATDAPDVEAAADRCVGELGGVDVLMTTVGGSDEIVPFLEVKPDLWHAVLDRNLTSTYLLASAFGRRMVERGAGSIIATSSQLGHVVRPSLAPYCTAKAAVTQLVKAIAVDLAVYGIRANAIAPGPTMNDKARRLLSESDVADDVAGTIVLGRFAEPDEMVGAAVFLASDESSFVTGSTVLVDGGYSLR